MIAPQALAWAVMMLSALTACQSSQGLGASDVERNTPYGTNGRAKAVDGLLVGHRLMAAGEYDLALRAYLRAAAEQGMSADVLASIGTADLHLGRLGQAEQILRRAVEADQTLVPALNNLGVVRMEQGQIGEARVLFQRAFALDSGETDSIRENLKRAIAQSEAEVYTSGNLKKPVMKLVRRGQGTYVLLSQL